MKKSTFFREVVLYIFIFSWSTILYAQEDNYVSTSDGLIRMDSITGVARIIMNIKDAHFSGTPIEIAWQYLLGNSDLLHNSETAELEFIREIENPAGIHLGFIQTVDEIPVIGSEIVVNLNGNNEITFISNGYKSGISISTIPAISSEEAIYAARQSFDNPGFSVLFPIKSQLSIFVDDNYTSYLVYQLNILPEEGGDWYILVDANTSNILRKENIEFSETGSGQVFDPDPGTHLQNENLPDNYDEDYPELFPAYEIRTLMGLNPPLG